MRKFNWFDITAMILIIVGAINWGLIGLFDFNLVSSLFGVESFLTNFIYTMVGIAGIYAIYTTMKEYEGMHMADTTSAEPRGF